MKVYDKNHLQKVICNCCGKELRLEKNIVKDGVVSLNIDWGYFSNKDGQVHSLEICEECYDKLAANLMHPVTVELKTEMI